MLTEGEHPYRSLQMWEACIAPRKFSFFVLPAGALAFGGNCAGIQRAYLVNVIHYHLQHDGGGFNNIVSFDRRSEVTYIRVAYSFGAPSRSSLYVQLQRVMDHWSWHGRKGESGSLK